MKITMFNVDFGDCVLYQGDSCLHDDLLVDCGSLSGSDCAYRRVADTILPMNNSLNLVITHFHIDHYNGLFNYDDDFKFKSITIPKIYYDGGEISISKNALLRAVYVDAVKALLGMEKDHSSFHDLFVKLPHLVNGKLRKIRCVGKGDILYSAGRQYDVLWPDLSIGNKLGNVINSIRGILREAVQGAEALIVIVNEYVQTFARIYAYYENEDKNETENDYGLFMERLELLHAQIMDHSRVDRSLSSDVKNRLNRVNNRVITDMNDCSVVLESGTDLLALGDVGEKVIKKLPLKEKYSVIKVQHHGTTNHWTDKLPKADNYLISNSGEKRINWKICAGYGKREGNKYCTNNREDRCLYYEEEGKPCWGSCHVCTPLHI